VAIYSCAIHKYLGVKFTEHLVEFVIASCARIARNCALEVDYWMWTINWWTSWISFCF